MTATADGWSTGQRISLALAFGAMFVAVVLVVGREPPAAEETLAREDATSGPAIASPPALTTAPPANAASDEKPAAKSAVPAAVAADPAEIAELTRQVMPLDETTAEENEQRGDAIRKLSSSPSGDNVSTLVYALRNDTDIRNRILAIDGLRRAALAGNSNRAIPDALADASRSGDEVIASQASQALAEIERAKPRR